MPGITLFAASKLSYSDWQIRKNCWRALENVMLKDRWAHLICVLDDLWTLFANILDDLWTLMR